MVACCPPGTPRLLPGQPAGDEAIVRLPGALLMGPISLLAPGACGTQPGANSLGVCPPPRHPPITSDACRRPHPTRSRHLPPPSTECFLHPHLLAFSFIRLFCRSFLQHPVLLQLHGGGVCHRRQPDPGRRGGGAHLPLPGRRPGRAPRHRASALWWGVGGDAAKRGGWLPRREAAH